MKKKEVKELHLKTLAELKNLQVELVKKLSGLKSEVKAGKVKDYRIVSKVRDDVARLASIMQEKKEEK